MKIASWNIEWMNRWFTPDRDSAAWKTSNEIDGVTDIQSLAKRVAIVIDEMKADVLLIQEGPSRFSELKLFVHDYLGDSYEIVGPSGKGQQKLYALIKIDGAVKRFERVYSNFLEESWSVDIDGAIINGQLTLEEYEFTRDPLILDISDDHKKVRVINVHLKSKYVHNGEKLWNNSATRPSFIIDAVKVRRRISAEAVRIREYLNELLSEDENYPIVVGGDFNEGPGIDFFERLYLTHNIIASVSGNPITPRQMFRHGFVDRMPKEENYTAVFNDFIDEIDDRKILLDHILVSPGLYSFVTDGKIDHDAFEKGIDANKPGHREQKPSDHRPQWITF